MSIEADDVGALAMAALEPGLVAVGDLPEPEWPTEPFRDLFRIAFRGRLIDTRDHLVLKRLRGEV